MGNQQNGSLIFLKSPLQLCLGVHIQMIGRLIQHQQVYGLLHNLAKPHLGSLTTRENHHLGGNMLIGKTTGCQSRPYLKLRHARIFLPNFLNGGIIIALGGFLLEITRCNEFSQLNIA